MNAYEGYEAAEKISRAIEGCRRPKDMAAALGIELYEFDLKNLKGMYSAADRHRTIYLNNRLNHYGQLFVTIHEIGHDQKHRHLAKNAPLREIQFFHGASATLLIEETENEANIIASHVLIKDDQLLKLLGYGYTISESAAQLHVPEDLVLIKMREMQRINRSLSFDLLRRGNPLYLKAGCAGSEAFFWDL